jgi:hypothetical protein
VDFVYPAYPFNAPYTSLSMEAVRVS